MKRKIAIAIVTIGLLTPGFAQTNPPPAAAAEAKVDYSKQIKVLFCTFNRSRGDWQIQLKNTTSTAITLETLGISIKDVRGIEVGRAGARNVLLKPGIVVFLKGTVDKSGSMDFSKAIKAEAVFNPENPDTYIK